MLASLERSGTKVVLATAQAQAWLGALNDLRLMLGTRLEIDEDPEVMQARIDLLDRLARSGEPGQDPARTPRPPRRSSPRCRSTTGSRSCRRPWCAP